LVAAEYPAAELPGRCAQLSRAALAAQCGTARL